MHSLIAHPTDCLAKLVFREDSQGAKTEYCFCSNTAGHVLEYISTKIQHETDDFFLVMVSFFMQLESLHF
jgi:hypothetical protein